IADYATRHLGMHVIDRQNNFTLIGSSARHGKLTLFDAEGPRERGSFAHVALRVSSLDGSPDRHDLPEGIEVHVVEAPTDIEYELDHVALFARAPERTAREHLAYGFKQAAAKDGVSRADHGGAFGVVHGGAPRA